MAKARERILYFSIIVLLLVTSAVYFFMSDFSPERKTTETAIPVAPRDSILDHQKTNREMVGPMVKEGPEGKKAGGRKNYTPEIGQDFQKQHPDGLFVDDISEVDIIHTGPESDSSLFIDASGLDIESDQYPEEGPEIDTSFNMEDGPEADSYQYSGEGPEINTPLDLEGGPEVDFFPYSEDGPEVNGSSFFELGPGE